MTEVQFIKNNTGVGDWPDLPKEFLASMYNKIKENEIKMNDGKGALAGAQKHGLLTRRSKRKNWKPAYFVLREKNLYIFKDEDEASHTSPEELEDDQSSQKKKEKKIMKVSLEGGVQLTTLGNVKGPKGKVVCELAVSSGSEQKSDADSQVLIAAEEEEVKA
eukprot:CAMPEP_0201530574 /NCGR_PEP_ID=MMETSP0161_2-20130828/45079_1 /ASSEMBLY_ACC=CAM_ASM_000251 /TAXON_ID=180227 /ORGANISM="Neoparamoeba aestuarina, Strain SoJaBio B1-5/56/2" /LENGTH=161 /DNA_ID=CAMNT_0047932991 /DNA_START=57 /DNA_END=538 /DNA_ORIENTATION=+